jgi:hypothetical protein
VKAPHRGRGSFGCQQGREALRRAENAGQGAEHREFGQRPGRGELVQGAANRTEQGDPRRWRNAQRRGLGWASSTRVPSMEGRLGQGHPRRARHGSTEGKPLGCWEEGDEGWAEGGLELEACSAGTWAPGAEELNG